MRGVKKKNIQPKTGVRSIQPMDRHFAACAMYSPRGTRVQGPRSRSSRGQAAGAAASAARDEIFFIFKNLFEIVSIFKAKQK